MAFPYLPSILDANRSIFPILPCELNNSLRRGECFPSRYWWANDFLPLLLMKVKSEVFSCRSKWTMWRRKDVFILIAMLTLELDNIGPLLGLVELLKSGKYHRSTNHVIHSYYKL